MICIFRAFTLAEVLITLLIIGVISSIIIPQIINDTQQAESKTAWKKAYGAATQAYKLAIVDNGTTFPAYGANSGLSQKWIMMSNRMNITKNCHGNTFGNCWAPYGVTKQDGTFYTGVCNGFYENYQNDTYAYVTADGMFWLVYGWGTGTMDLVSVDVNGLKGPNMFGKDVFSFSIEESKLSICFCGNSQEATYYLSN